MDNTLNGYKPAVTRYELECNQMDPVGDEATLRADIALAQRRALKRSKAKKNDR